MRGLGLVLLLACACANERPPGQDIASCSVSTLDEQPLLFDEDEALVEILYPIIEIATAELVCHPGQGQGCTELIAERCVNHVGDVGIGDLARFEVSIFNVGPVDLTLHAVHIDSACPDLYIEGGAPLDIVPAEGSISFDLIVRPTDLGACEGTLVIDSSSGNAPEEGATMAFTANRVVGDRAPGCTADGACCCGDEAPTCDDWSRVSCTAPNRDAVWFDDMCANPDRCSN